MASRSGGFDVVGLFVLLREEAPKSHDSRVAIVRSFLCPLKAFSVRRLRVNRALYMAGRSFSHLTTGLQTTNFKCWGAERREVEKTHISTSSVHKNLFTLTRRSLCEKEVRSAV